MVVADRKGMVGRVQVKSVVGVSQKACPSGLAFETFGLCDVFMYVLKNEDVCVVIISVATVEQSV